MCWLMCVFMCGSLCVKVHFLHSGKVTLIWAGVLSGMSPWDGTKGENRIVHGCSVSPLRTHPQQSLANTSFLSPTPIFL